MIQMSIYRPRGHRSLLSLPLVEDFCMRHLYRKVSLLHQSNPCLLLWRYVVSQLSIFAVALSINIPSCSKCGNSYLLYMQTIIGLKKPVYHHITGPMKKLARLVGRGNLTSIAGFVIKILHWRAKYWMRYRRLLVMRSKSYALTRKNQFSVTSHNIILRILVGSPCGQNWAVKLQFSYQSWKGALQKRLT